MKTVVITGSARGFGFELAKVFRKNDFNVVLSDINEGGLEQAKELLLKVESEAIVECFVCDVTNLDMIQNLWDYAKHKFENVDMWINNAGVNQPNKPVYELTGEEVEFLMNVDLKGTIFGSKVAFKGMKEQGFGQIFNVEGYGSNDATMTGLSIYGTAKRAVTYFTQALAKESKEIANNVVLVGRLAPGIMITNFIKTANGGKTTIELEAKTKKIYNILGDYPQTIAEYVVPKMIANNKNNKRIIWLSNARAFRKFFSFMFKKRDFFKE